MNQLISSGIAEKLEALMTEERLHERGRRASEAKFDAVLANIFGAPPAAGDELPEGYKKLAKGVGRAERRRRRRLRSLNVGGGARESELGSEGTPHGGGGDMYPSVDGFLVKLTIEDDHVWSCSIGDSGQQYIEYVEGDRDGNPGALLPT